MAHCKHAQIVTEKCDVNTVRVRLPLPKSLLNFLPSGQNKYCLSGQTSQPEPSAGLDISTASNSNKLISAPDPPEVAFELQRAKWDKLASEQVASQFSKVGAITPRFF
jgi:hypothetical protein